MQIYYFSSKQQRNEEKKGLVIALGNVTIFPPNLFLVEICKREIMPQARCHHTLALSKTTDRQHRPLGALGSKKDEEIA